MRRKKASAPPAEEAGPRQRRFEASATGRAFLAARARVRQTVVSDAPGWVSKDPLTALAVAFVHALPEGGADRFLLDDMLERLKHGRAHKSEVAEAMAGRKPIAPSLFSSISSLLPRGLGGALPKPTDFADVLLRTKVLEEAPGGPNRIRIAPRTLQTYAEALTPDSGIARIGADWVRAVAFYAAVEIQEAGSLVVPMPPVADILRVAIDWFDKEDADDALILASLVTGILGRNGMIAQSPETMEKLAFAAEERELAAGIRLGLWAGAAEARCREPAAKDRKKSAALGRASFERALSLLEEALASPDAAIRDLPTDEVACELGIAEADVLLERSEDAYARFEELLDRLGSARPFSVSRFHFAVLRFHFVLESRDDLALSQEVLQFALDVVGKSDDPDTDAARGVFSLQLAKSLTVSRKFREALLHARTARAVARRRQPPGPIRAETEELATMLEMAVKKLSKSM